MVCDLADINYRKVISAANYLKELPPRAGYVYLNKLLDDGGGDD